MVFHVHVTAIAGDTQNGQRPENTDYPAPQNEQPLIHIPDQRVTNTYSVRIFDLQPDAHEGLLV